MDKPHQVLVLLFTLLLVLGFISAQSRAAVIVEWNIPDAGSQPWELVADQDNNIWFVKSLGNGVCKLYPRTGSILEFTLSGVSPWGISADIEEKWIYFTDRSEPPKIYRVDATKDEAGFDVFTIDSDGGYVSQLRGIHVQNSTCIWFASYGTHRIGLLNMPSGSPPSYSVTYWTLPDFCTPLSLVYDEESGLWFTDEKGNTIGNIPKPTDDVINFYYLASGSTPTDIDVDLFGNVWFTESGRNRIGKINPRLNELTEYSIPISDSKPYGVAVDYSNRVWVTLYNENAIAVFNPDTNTFSMYERVVEGYPAFIATSKNRGTPIFFTDAYGKVGKIDPNLEVTTIIGQSLSTVTMSRTTGSSTKSSSRFTDTYSSNSKSPYTMRLEGVATTYTAPETVTLVRTSTSDITTYYVTQTAITSTLITVVGTYTSYIATTTGTLTTIIQLTTTTYRTPTPYTTWTTSPETGVLIVPGYQAPSIFLGLIIGSTILLSWCALKKRLERGSKPIQVKKN